MHACRHGCHWRFGWTALRHLGRHQSSLQCSVAEDSMQAPRSPKSNTYASFNSAPLASTPPNSTVLDADTGVKVWPCLAVGCDGSRRVSPNDDVDTAVGFNTLLHIFFQPTSSAQRKTQSARHPHCRDQLACTDAHAPSGRTYTLSSQSRPD
jgi:hypothetical protein